MVLYACALLSWAKLAMEAVVLGGARVFSTRRFVGANEAFVASCPLAAAAGEGGSS